MNTIEKAQLYSATLKQHFGVGVDESLDLASVLDELVEEIAYDQTIIDVLILDKDALSKKVTAQRRVLEKAQAAGTTQADA